MISLIKEIGMLIEILWIGFLFNFPLSDRMATALAARLKKLSE